MALDRTSITRRDFPTNRKGYDPASVDAHLATLADEVHELERRASASSAPLAAATGEQVRAIVEAAERSVAGMRTDAKSEAREHVARVAEAAEELRAKLEQAERDVTAVLTHLREGVARLHDDLLALQAGTAALGASAEPLPPAPDGADEVAAPPRPLRSVPAPEPAPTPEPEPEPVRREEPPPAAAVGPDDTDAARIVALDLALSGTPREEADRIIAGQYTVADRSALLDEVYAAAGA
ncbi:MAG: DivIVA domain-containing protein [Solirubrobacteraceae bacterium]